MKAILYHEYGPDVLKLREIDKPAVKDDEDRTFSQTLRMSQRSKIQKHFR